MRKTRPKGRNVKSRQALTVDHRQNEAIRYITGDEFSSLLKGARTGRHPQRDALIVKLLYQHGFRATELTKLKRSDIKLDDARIFVRRLKGSLSTEQPLSGTTLRTLRAHLRARTDKQPWVFISERGAPLTRQGLYSLIGAMAKRVGMDHTHPHMLRHGCGFALANKGRDTRLIQDYLGHKDIKNTVIYTRTAAKRFEGLWED